MKPSTIRGIHSILSGAFAAAQRWEWTDRNPAESAKPPTTIRRPIPATSPDDVAKVIAEARGHNAALGLYLWLVVVTGVRRGELCGLQIRDIDLDRGLIHVAFNYVVRGGQRVRKDTKTHQDRWLAIDPDTCALIASYLDEAKAALAAVGVELRDDAYLFSNDPAHSRPWNPDRATHSLADQAKVSLCVVGVIKLRCRCDGFRSLRSVTIISSPLPSAWTGSWTGALDNSSAVSAVNATTCVICAASALGARGRTSCKRQVIGSDRGGS
jgi:integrase